MKHSTLIKYIANAILWVALIVVLGLQISKADQFNDPLSMINDQVVNPVGANLRVRPSLSRADTEVCPYGFYQRP